jgi:hypothetical protein
LKKQERILLSIIHTVSRTGIATTFRLTPTEGATSQSNVVETPTALQFDYSDIIEYWLLWFGKANNICSGSIQESYQS